MKRDLLIFTTVLFLILANAGCSFKGVGGTSDNSPLRLTIESVTGTDSSGSNATTMESDVGSNTSDSATVTFRLETKTVGITTSNYYSVLLSRYTVTYSSFNGEEVPSPFSGNMSYYISLSSNNSTTSPSIDLVVVRASAKGLSPLKDLKSGKWLHTTARIDFYGKDGYGNEISASGYINIDFYR